MGVAGVMDGSFSSETFLPPLWNEWPFRWVISDEVASSFARFAEATIADWILKNGQFLQSTNGLADNRIVKMAKRGEQWAIPNRNVKKIEMAFVRIKPNREKSLVQTFLLVQTIFANEIRYENGYSTKLVQPDLIKWFLMEPDLICTKKSLRIPTRTQ